MRKPQHDTIKLPARLLQELGQPGGQNGRNRDRNRWNKTKNGPAGRKERRKMERAEKRRGVIPRAKGGRGRVEEETHGEELYEEEESEDEVAPERKASEKPAANISKASAAPLRSILKNSTSTMLAAIDHQEDDEVATTLPKLSRSVRNKLAEDDEEIKALEKLLGVKGKKKPPKGFEDDGMNEILEGLEAEESDEDSSRKRKREDDAWLWSKRRGVELQENRDTDSETGSVVELDLEEDDSLDFDEEASDLEEARSESSFSGFGSDTTTPAAPPARVRENPYLAPVAPSQPKYIPPSLRAPPSSETESLTRLRRQLLGLLNRLSEANLLSILSELEKLYSSNPRQYVTSTLCSLLLDLICDETALNNTFIILHAGFITSVYKVVGPDFGAEMLSQIVLKLDSLFPASSTHLTTKGPLNLISLLSSLYTFSMMTSHLLFAYIRQFLTTLTDAHTEFILKIILSCGPDLRRSDPSSLKSIVLLLQTAITAAGGESTIPVRTKFMIETITALKNNRMRTGVAASAIAAEHTMRVKKILGSLNDGRQTIRATEPLNLSLEDVRNTEKRGKWWLVGSSWHPSTQPERESSDAVPNKQNGDPDPDPEADTVSIHQLASQNHMSTPTRNLLFTTLLSEPDYRSAAQTLSNVPLKKNVFRTEMPRVLLQCVGAEEIYNPYYSLVARRLCELDRRVGRNIRFALWDFLKRFGEGEDDEGDEIGDTRGVSMRKIVNTAKFISGLILARTLGLDEVFRPVEDLRYLRRGGNTFAFIEVLLVTAILDSRPKEREKGQGTSDCRLTAIFSFGAKEDASGLREALKWFLRNVVRKSDLVKRHGKEKEKLASGCSIASKALSRVETMQNDEDVTDQ